jgi:arginase family enzyme
MRGITTGCLSYALKGKLPAGLCLIIIGTEGDVVEVSPPFDPAGITALAGAQMMFEILCLTAATFAQRSGR